MDTNQLKTMVTDSRLLTQAEKDYWLNNLEYMTPEQTERLEEILNRAQQIKWNEHIEHYMSVIGKTAKAYNEANSSTVT